MLTTRNNPIFLQANWQAPANIHTCLTTAVSEFNVAKHTNHNPELVELDRKLLIDKITTSQPLWLNQIHSNIVIDWDTESDDSKLVTADAALTRKSGKVCVVMTADCLPILLTNQKGNFVAAVHAGWRGLHSNIIEETINKLAPLTPNNMLAFIGPAICQKCFEIGEEVRDLFLDKDKLIERYFIRNTTTKKYHANLRGIACQKLINLGLQPENITNQNICSKCYRQWFYSYRANPHCGRLATLIWMD